MILKAVLLGQSLPGRNQAIRFPDLSFILNQRNILLADENLFGQISLEELPRSIRILPMEELRNESQGHGDIAYLRFQPAEVNKDEVQMTMEAKIYTSDANKQTLGLSSIHVKFLKVEGQWIAADDPVLYAV